MKTPRKSVALLLPLLLSGCFHKAEQAQNQPPLAPPVVDPHLRAAPAACASKDLPPVVVSVPPTQPAPEPAPEPNKSTDQKPKHPVKHTTKPDSKTDPKPTEQASNNAPEVSAIGQLSAGDPSDLRNQTEDSIASTERGVNSLNRQLNDQEQKTVSQIREFLKQARTALSTGDVDGAHTLALKAKVLLGELNQQ